MADPKIARAWFLVTAVAVVVAIGIQLPETAATADGWFSTPLYRVLNLFTFFTICSNLLVGLASALLVIRPDRRSTAFDVLRLTGVVAIAVTGVVYHLLLAGLVELSPVGALSNLLTHTVVPLLGVVGWLLFGPRGRTSWRVVALTLVFPLGWLAFTLVRGPLAGGWYPYPFLDISELGLGTVLLNGFGIGVVFLGLSAGAHALDRVLAGGTVYRGLRQD